MLNRIPDDDLWRVETPVLTFNKEVIQMEIIAILITVVVEVLIYAAGRKKNLL
jgi:hypothetical protein